MVAVGAINNISFMLPPFSPLTQPEDIRDNAFCDENNLPQRCNGSEICHCVHRLRVKKDAIVELIIVDETEGRNRLFCVWFFDYF
jgi:hypothetical protein